MNRFRRRRLQRSHHGNEDAGQVQRWGVKYPPGVWVATWRYRETSGSPYFPVDETRTVFATTELATESFKTADGSWPGNTGRSSSGVITGWVQPKYAESYTLQLIIDDYAQGYWNGELVMPSTGLFKAKKWTSPILAPGLAYKVVVQCVNMFGPAQCLLRWSSASQESTFVPAVKVG